MVPNKEVWEKARDVVASAVAQRRRSSAEGAASSGSSASLARGSSGLHFTADNEAAIVAAIVKSLHEYKLGMACGFKLCMWL